MKAGAFEEPHGLRGEPARRLRAGSALCEFHRLRRPADQVVAWRGTAHEGCELSHARLRSDIAHFARRAADAGVARGDRVGLWSQDGFAFAVGLFGLWQRGAVVVSLPNDGSGSFEAMAARGWPVACDVPDRAGALPALSLGFAVGDDALAPDVAALQALDEAPPLERDALALELSTSGTTGDGSEVTKRLRHLEDEVLALERHFGASLGRARVVATPSHQHLYGLLFRVLWPLAAARPFHARGLLQAEEIGAAVGPGEPFALASVPAHLSRIAQREAAARLAGNCVRIFSSGGPLASETAARWRELTGEAPTEIFGSTETGGVAWRSQSGPIEEAARTAWQPFDCARVERAGDGRLRVSSPLVSVGEPIAGGDESRFSMGDRVSLAADGRFVLEGRADRVVKIGERRLSLPEMEARLVSLPEVSDAALVTLEVAGEPRVGAAVVVREGFGPGGDPESRRALARSLSDALARDFERVLLPRAWRFVEALPEDAQGKRTVGKLRALFEAADGDAVAGRAARFDAMNAARAPVPRPTVLETRREAGACAWLCEVPADLPELAGHFPGAPIVPAVSELGWALALAADHAAEESEGEGSPFTLRSIDALRLREPLVPGQRFWLRVERHGAAPSGGRSERLDFTLHAAPDGVAAKARELASGRLVVERV